MAKYQFGWKTENFKNKHLLSHIKMLEKIITFANIEIREF